MKINKYEVFSDRIRIVEIEKETDSCVWIHGIRRSKKGVYFDTFEDGKAWLVKECELKVESLRRLLESANGKLGNAKGLSRP